MKEISCFCYFRGAFGFSENDGFKQKAEPQRFMRFKETPLPINGRLEILASSVGVMGHRKKYYNTDTLHCQKVRNLA